MRIESLRQCLVGVHGGAEREQVLYSYTGCAAGCYGECQSLEELYCQNWSKCSLKLKRSLKWQTIDVTTTEQVLLIIISLLQYLFPFEVCLRSKLKLINLKRTLYLYLY